MLAACSKAGSQSKLLMNVDLYCSLLVPVVSAIIGNSFAACGKITPCPAKLCIQQNGRVYFRHGQSVANEQGAARTVHHPWRPYAIIGGGFKKSLERDCHNATSVRTRNAMAY
jgi:hypothetical protein